MLERFRQTRQALRDPSALQPTLARLVTDGRLTAEEAERLREGLPATLESAGYVAGHQAALLAIGAFFAFDFVPLPLGTLSRVAWVGTHRVYCEVRRERAKARVHSVQVLLVAAIPWLGYFAYLLPLRHQNRDAAYLFAHHISYERRGVDADTYLESCSRLARGILRRFVYDGRR